MQRHSKHWEPYIDPDLSLPHSHPLSFLLPLPLELLFGFEILGSCVFCSQERLGWLWVFSSPLFVSLGGLVDIDQLTFRAPFFLFLFFFSLWSSTVYRIPLILELLRLYIREISFGGYGTMSGSVEDVIHILNWHSILMGVTLFNMWKSQIKWNFLFSFLIKNAAAAHSKFEEHRQVQHCLLITYLKLVEWL